MGVDTTVAHVLKRVSYWPPIVRLGKVLGLGQLLRRLYYRWAGPVGGILHIQIGSTTIQFAVPTPEDLRAVEAVAYGERHVWEVLCRLLSDGDTFYDVGSSVGPYAVLAGKVVGEQGLVVAFEPDRKSYTRLEENLKLNRLTNVRYFELALGDRNGQGELYYGEHSAASSLVYLDGLDKGHQMIQIVKGDWLAKVENLPTPKAVKIDVQGYEFAVLQGLRNTLAEEKCNLVCCEIHPKLLPSGVTPEEVHALFKSLGFSRIDIYPRGNDYHAICYKTSATV